MTKIDLYIDREEDEFPNYPWLINRPMWDEVVELQYGLEYDLWQKREECEPCIPDVEHINHL